MNHSVDPEISERVIEMGGAELRLDFRNARSRFFQNRPRLQETFIEQVYLEAIAAAKSEVLISNAYFIASEAFRRTATEAARRCVRLVVLTNSPETNDLPPLTIVGREHYAAMLAVNEERTVEECRRTDPQAGLEIWEWQGRRADQAERVEGTNHGKWAVFDRTVSLVGSHNLDPRSERLNSESAVVFRSEALARTLARRFYREDLPMSRRIPLEEARRFERDGDALYRLERAFGDIFEDEL
jgi:phosphatidylserine/phosphatidylglycerophosphate/cardiolipin synthase-like enzyme